MSKGWKKLGAASTAQRMVIVDPTTGVALKDKDGQEAFIDLYSLESPAIDDVRREMFDRAVTRSQRNSKRIMTLDESREQSADLLAAATAGWYLVDFEGEPIDEPFSKESARELYLDPDMTWLKEQVDDFVADKRNFIKRS